MAVHGEAWTSCVLCATMSDQGNLSASFVPSTVTWPVLWSHKGGGGGGGGGGGVHKGCSPCVKGVERTNSILDTLSTGYTRQAFSVFNAWG